MCVRQLEEGEFVIALIKLDADAGLRGGVIRDGGVGLEGDAQGSRCEQESRKEAAQLHRMHRRLTKS